jgi:thymidylate synthase (FAD)
MRHRSWAFNEISRRYTSENVQCYRPAQLWSQGNTNRQVRGVPIETVANRWMLAQYDGLTADAVAFYHTLVDSGVAHEQARLVLPQSMFTAFYGTASLRSALHFIGLRADEAAQGEMISYAVALGEIVAVCWPLTWAAWQAHASGAGAP